MDGPALNLIVLRTQDLAAAAAFYAALGFVFTEEQHGHGPPHLAAMLPNGVVLELYPAAPSFELERGALGDVRLGVAVADVAATVAAVVEQGGRVVAEPRDRDTNRVAVVADPDGRRVEITSTGR